MLRFPHSILSLTSLCRAWQALSTVITTSTRSLAVFEFRYRFPDYPTKVMGREGLMALYAGYGEGMVLHGADALVVNISQTPGVVILEYEVQGNAVGSGKLYENRFISVITIENRKIVGWRDYMDSLAAMSSLS
jgi:limonene-1,2-epoxide hydrolase